MATDFDENDDFPGAEDNFYELAEKNLYATSLKEQFYHMSIGYKDAADCLVAHVAEARRDVRKFGCPIMFLYRHHIELALKDLILDSQSFLGHKEIFPKTHRIDKLWQVCRDLLNQISPGMSNNEEIQQTTRLLADFRKIDPTSITFRYPEGNNNNSSLHDNAVFDLNNVKDVISKMSLLLECISEHVSSLKENNF